MKTVAILQARTTSTRLPRKALLPVAGYPAAVLAALRAGNRGMSTIVATSDDSSDDELCAVLRSHGVTAFRGPLEDVLRRYYLASSDLSEDSAIIRLTGDNVLPDGDFVQQLAIAFHASGLEYMTTDSERLPYGLGAEAFTVKALRRAHDAAERQPDREHVGPWMMRNCPAGKYLPDVLGDADYSHLRCTIDDEEDYRRVLNLFGGVESPVAVGWLQLMHKVASLPGAPSFRVPFRTVAGRTHSEFTLGTAQLGMDYGIVNQTGKPSRADGIAMVRHAIAHGVTHIDTARAYGDSEEVLGAALTGGWRSRAEVVTKLDTLGALPFDANAEAVRAAVDESVAQSCRHLNTSRLSTLLLHRWEHRSAWHGAVWQRLLEMRDRGIVGSLGVSVSEPREALEALQDPVVRHLQIPLNLLDWRWKASGVDRASSGRPDVVVHARSPFLQGILLNPARTWPVTDYDVEGSVRGLRDLAQKFERQNLADLCLAYLRGQPWITSIVVGCDTLAQLHGNLECFRSPRLTAEQCAEVEWSLPRAPDSLLNPVKWKIQHEQPALR
jgi:spore coat polysaccharide biosynthesis protein SpsF (cytidylyltransferase family)/aryl-alcohol dehydrogenase-like predicted oxidoreductase